MKITYRDFLDAPYIQGWSHCKQIFTKTSLSERVTKIALTILLWFPFVNVGAHLILKKIALTIPLTKLSPHLSFMSLQEKRQYADHSTDQPYKTGTWDYLCRDAHFGTNYQREALMKVNNRQGSSGVFDLRKIEYDSSHGSTLYCPFKISLFPHQRTYISDSAAGWLVLSHSEGAIYINRMDNFSKLSKVRLGSALVQFAIELSLKEGYGGKVAVRSTNGSAGFYYRLGFVCKDPELQKKVVEEYQTNKRTLDGWDMYLSAEAIEMWKQKIANTPILGK
ncbi:MAG: hypothetical protein Q8L98_02635 [Chlamydiales bacterium]|nr:hypothetical protein [Chlamydiales bacterium]